MPIGYRHTERTKKVLSQQRLGNTFGRFNKGRVMPKHERDRLRLLATGRFHSDVTRLKLRELNRDFVHESRVVVLLSEINLGERNPNWCGGHSNEPYPIEFRERLKERIRARDGYRCRLCGIPQLKCLRALDVHHIDHDKNNLAESNLISLCVRCNGKCNSPTFVPQFIPLDVIFAS
jgi:hypothetical protein